MEHSEKEMLLIQQTAEASSESALTELTDLQLAHVGGGGGDVVFH